jgi:hypothetical protein
MAELIRVLGIQLPSFSFSQDDMVGVTAKSALDVHHHALHAFRLSWVDGLRLPRCLPWVYSDHSSWFD